MPAFLWEKLGILKERREKASGAASALNPRAGKCAFAIRFPRPFLIAGPAATQMRVPSLLLILSERQSTSTSAGKNIPSSELRALDFIGSGKQDEPRTQNILELGIPEFKARWVPLLPRESAKKTFNVGDRSLAERHALFPRRIDA